MQCRICLDDVGAQPGSLFLNAILRCGTAFYHPVKVFVDGEAVAVLLDQLPHGVTHVDLFGKDHETLQRAIPPGFFPMERVPREEAVGVSKYQPVYRQVPAHGHQTAFLTQMGVREPEVIV